MKSFVDRRQNNNNDKVKANIESGDTATGAMRTRFWPHVDYNSETPFFGSHPITILHNKQQKMVPFMTGLNADEGKKNSKILLLCNISF